jgi:hypothetical protein
LVKVFGARYVRRDRGDTLNTADGRDRVHTRLVPGA